MSTIPAKRLVQVLPSVLSAGGAGLVLNGLFLTTNTRVPFGEVMSLPSSTAANDFFGATTTEAGLSGIYFGGYNGATQLPGSMLFAQFPQSAISAYLRGGNASGYSLAQLQALSGNISVAIDGYTRTATGLSLSSATSFTAAAGSIQTALNASPSVLASFTGSIGSASATFTASITGGVMNVTAVNGTLYPGGVITGAGIASGTTIDNQLTVSGSGAGGTGTYAVNIAQNIASENMTSTYGILTVSNFLSGSISIGQTVQGTGVSSTTQVTALLSASGTAGTYIVSPGQSIAAEGMTTIPTPVTVTYDSVSGGFIIESGVVGSASSAASASGTLAVSLFLTTATGASISEGSPGLTPGAFMDQLVEESQNWASFMLVQDPDNGSGNTQKMLFADWVGEQDDEFAFIDWDTDITPTESTNAASSQGQLIEAAEISGVCLIWDTGPNTAAFICGAIASVDFSQTNGRLTFAGRSQSGLVAQVTSDTVQANLIANGYNFYGAYGSATQTFVQFQNGSISGPFAWLDSYINQIWLNSQFQVDLLTLLANINSIPYTPAGSAIIASALSGTIQQAVLFGAIAAGVTLSASQILEVNAAAGANIATTLQNRGWYLLVGQATPQTRAARSTPPCTFYYTDGQAVQQITLSSVELQ